MESIQHYTIPTSHLTGKALGPGLGDQGKTRCDQEEVDLAPQEEPWRLEGTLDEEEPPLHPQDWPQYSQPWFLDLY